ncbi:aryl-sulfate sulfotransferase [Maribacter sp. PR1]|uniref:Aryl-sulfate sulfotransferase n=1 Tax=Maribacter cobaltidurans TaxID=1178778 RepID=A0ABU7INZ7_9FLAO|nr:MULTISPECIES: aryl-sulfate sulfotransferase [Maribacter]MDC6387224.1 aryl-sulfate sulfotransferase [Maribacter sp. PR1]MEE1974609.1 aryl-sulfate sulfotransferase [Maribacter cobaltidurans]
MKRFFLYPFLLFCTLGCLIISCENQSDSPIIEEISEENILSEDEIEEEIDSEIEEGITYSLPSEVYDGLVLINDAAANRVYLINKNGKTIYEWPLGEERLGNDVYLMDNGKLLAMLEVPDPKIKLGGFGGKVSILNKDASVEWSYTYATDNYILHHDALMLPNGNVLTMVWERKTSTESIEAGYILNTETFPDGLIEINPDTNTIVWEWYVWDHLIQDFDETKANYGNVSANPQRIDINYTVDESGDLTHGNGIAYDASKDVIYLSANFYSEIWVIDHSTTKEEAKGSNGGNYSKGGDLIYRFGNPSAYKNNAGKRLFTNNHFPNLLEGIDTGKIMIFSNGGELERSTVYEIQLPNEFDLHTGIDNEPNVTWTYTNQNLYAPKVSGAVKLPNGNVLIAEGDFGLWEVTKEKQIAWKFKRNGFYWRAYHYNENDDSIINLGLEE